MYLLGYFLLHFWSDAKLHFVALYLYMCHDNKVESNLILCGDKGALCSHACDSTLTSGFSARLSLQVPPAMKAGSFFCEEMLSFNIFLSWAAAGSSESLRPLRLQRVLNIVPAPLTSVWGHGCERSRWKCLRQCVLVTPECRRVEAGWWKRTLMAPLTLRMRAEGGKNNYVIQSVLFFLLFHGLWRGGVVGRSCACDQLHLFLTDE